MNDLISRQAAIDALDVLCQEHRYKIPGKIETYSQYNEAWQDALDRAEGAIGILPSAQPDVPESCVGNMISRQAAIDAVRSYYDECDEREESIEERIERLPSADIDLSDFSDKLWAAAYERGKAEAQAEIVRCKDCMYWVAHDKRCAYLNHGFAPNMWCCHGRRTDEKENI